MKAVISFGIILNNVALTVLILQVAMPCMVTVSVVAKESNADYVYVTECIFLSTLISLVSIPFNYYIIEQLLL
jgi:predicted permease